MKRRLANTMNNLINRKVCKLHLVLFLLPACNPKYENNKPVSLGPKIVETRGYEVPKDSMAEPRVIQAGKPKVVKAGIPKVFYINTNVHPAGNPKVITAGIPKVCTPGQDGFSLPEKVPAIGRPYPAGIPEEVIAREAYSKEQNPQNFSSFGKLQGLKNNVIYCMLQDKNGNLWFGTQGGGVIKYDGKSFSQFTEKQGLSQFVRSILEDKSGNLWFGTWTKGVIKYDGKSFIQFTEKDGLSNNYILSILEAKDGTFWFGTMYGGVNKYDGKSFTHFTTKEGLSSNHVECILEDKNRNLWFGTDAGINKYDGKSFTHFTTKEGLSNNIVLSILEDKRGNLWFGTKAGVNKYDATSDAGNSLPAGQASFTHFTTKEGLSSNSVLSILEDKCGNIWFGTGGGGVSKYDASADAGKSLPAGQASFTHFTEKEGLSNSTVSNILEDKNGNLWFGTEGGGVSKYYGRRFTHYTEKERMNINEVYCILQDKRGNIWFGTRNGGVKRYDGKSFTYFTTKEGLINNRVQSILEDKVGNLWFGTEGGVCKFTGKEFTYFTDKEGLCNNDVKCILEDKEGNLWFGTNGGGVSKFTGKEFIQFTKKEGLSIEGPLSLLEDKNGNLWFCGFNGGVSKYDASGDDGKSLSTGQARFTHFTMKEGLSHNDVRSIIEDKSGNIWFGTLGGGVIRYDGTRLTIFTVKEGLSNNYVRSLLQDKSENIWIGTNFGLNKLEKNQLSVVNKSFASTESEIIFKTYTDEDGFTGIGVNVGKTIFEARDGTIWIGADDRLTAFHPGVETQDTTGPNIQLTSLTLFNENIPWQEFMLNQEGNNQRSVLKDTSIVLGNGVALHDFHFDSVSKWYGLPEHLSLAYNNNNLTFQFVGITIQSPKKVKYQYKLEGLDQNWSAATNHSEVTYSILPPNKYTFKVKAINGDGYWSKELNYSFIIRPPWWSTWWFRMISMTMSIALIVLILYVWLQFKFRQKLKVELIRQKLAADLHDEIGSNLSSMAFSAELAKMKLNGTRQDIEVLLNNLVSSSRETTSLISETIWSLNPKNDSFDKLMEHMKDFTYQILASKEITCQFDSNDKEPLPLLDLEQRRNIYLIYKEAIHNIAKHSKASQVHILIETLQDHLSIEISDNGIGFDITKSHQGNGLNNFKARSGDSCEVHFSSEIGKGTVVHIMVNYAVDLKRQKEKEKNK